MNRRASAFGIGVLCLLGACSDHVLSSPEQGDERTSSALAGLIISNASSDVAQDAPFGTVAALRSASKAYISAAPGTFPHAVSVTIRNSTSGGVATRVSLVDGGFDPVGVDANDGDELELSVRLASGSVTSMTIDVPVRKRPVIVRVSPPKGATDVPLNARMDVVFSEPIERGSVTAATVLLAHNGISVAGEVTLSDDGLSAQFTPSNLLTPNTAYTLIATQGLLDLDGDALADESMSWFTTIVTTISTVPVAHVVIDPPLPSYIAGTSAQMSAVLRDSRGRVLTDREISWGSSNPQVATISASGVLTAVMVGSCTIFASSEGRTSQVNVTVVNAGGASGEMVFLHWTSRNIYQVASNGSELRQLTFSGSDWNPQYSPDGQRIAFSRRQFTASDIYVMNSDGTNATRLTAKQNFLSAAWSPDGSTLAISDEGVYDADIYLISSTLPRSTPVHLASAARSPAWSPDGQSIAFVRTSGDDGYHQVVVVGRDGTGQRDVTEVDEGGIYGLSWSPDGTRLTFSKCMLGDCELYVVNADGTGARAITNVGRAGWAAWSGDGNWIATDLRDWSTGSLSPSIAYVSADGGSPTVVAINGVQPSWRPMPTAALRK